MQKYELQAVLRSSRPVRYVIIDLSPVSHVDTTALHTFLDVHTDYAARNIQLCLSNPSQIVMKRLASSGVVEKIGSDYIFVTVHDAVGVCLGKLAEMRTEVGNGNNDDTDATGNAAAHRVATTEAESLDLDEENDRMELMVESAV